MLASSLVFLSYSVLIVLFLTGTVRGYENYTVGDSLGWYDNTENPNVDYQKWASNKTFSLGDFLIFNTNNNHSVVQTYNMTTYKLCDSNDALDNDTIEWSTADPSNTATQPATVPVPLLKEGGTYFFSGDYDGDQCKNGQHFQINVTRGQGLPPSLQDPTDQAPGPDSAQAGDDDDTPVTIVPSSNFDHPQDVSDHNGDSSGSSSLHERLWNVTTLNRVWVLCGVFSLFY